MNKQRTQGFTLPQLLVATAIGGILLVSVGMLVNTGLNAQTSETSQTAAKTAIRRINENIASTVRSGSFGVMEKLNSKAATMVFLNQGGAYSVQNSGSFRSSSSLTLQGSETLDLSSGERVMLINNAGDAVMMNVTSVAGRTITHDCKNTIPFTANTRLFKTTSYGVALGSALGSGYNANSLYEMLGGSWSEIAYDVADFSLRTLYRDASSNTLVVDPAVPASFAGLDPAFVPEAPTSARQRVPNVPNVTVRSGTEYGLYALAVTTTKTGVSGGDTLNRAYGEQMPLTSDSSSPVRKLYNCAGGSDVGTDSGGTLYVGVNNAPTPPAVVVNGPSGWSRSFGSSQSYENLQNGTYTGTAPDITYNTYETWRARWTSNPSTVNSWTGARMIADYERLPGTLNVQVSGLPAGVDASGALTLSGPGGYARSNWSNGANTIADARPGSYTANPGDVRSGLAIYRGTATPTTVGLYSGATQTITVNYGAVNGTLNVVYNSNGQAPATINISSPNGYSNSLTVGNGTTSLQVPPGSYSATTTWGIGNSPVDVNSEGSGTLTITAPAPALPPAVGNNPSTSATANSLSSSTSGTSSSTSSDGGTGARIGSASYDYVFIPSVTYAAPPIIGYNSDAAPISSVSYMNPTAPRPTTTSGTSGTSAFIPSPSTTGTTDMSGTSGTTGSTSTTRAPTVTSNATAAFDPSTSSGSGTTTGGTGSVAGIDGGTPMDVAITRVGHDASRSGNACSNTTRPKWLNRLLVRFGRTC